MTHRTTDPIRRLSSIERELHSRVLEPYAHVSAERVAAHLKHRLTGSSMEEKRAWDPRWLPVLTEEVGEVARVICEEHIATASGETSEALRRERLYSLRDELVQVAAMACAWIDSCQSEIDGSAT